MFELIEYGDGTWAISFKDGKVDKRLIGKTVTVALNVFIEGNRRGKVSRLLTFSEIYLTMSAAARR